MLSVTRCSTRWVTTKRKHILVVDIIFHVYKSGSICGDADESVVQERTRNEGEVSSMEYDGGGAGIPSQS